MRYGAIVIGAGVGGLGSAALLVAQGRTVLLLEASDRIGGFQRCFERSGFTFEPNFHFLQDAGPGRPVRQLLDMLGIQQHFYRVDPVARLSFPDGSLDITNDRTAYISRLKADFASETAGIDKMFEMQLGIYTEFLRQQPSPLLEHYAGDTVDDFVSRFVSDPRLKARASAWAAYFGYGRAQISALAIAVFTESCWDGGIYHPSGGVGSIERSLQSRMEAGGGQLRLDATVSQIDSANGRICGVTLTDGSRYEADVVISAVDTQSTVDMVTDRSLAAPLQAQLQPLQRFRSPFCVYLGVKSANLGLREGAAVRIDFHSYDSEAQDRAQVAGDIEHAPLSVGVATRYNTDLAPAGHDIVILYTFVRNDIIATLISEPSRSQNFAERLVARAERVIPGLKYNLVILESSATATPMLYNANSKGALGWAPTPEMLPQMPDHRSPVPGLFLAGQWTRTGGGMNNVLASAHLATSAALPEISA